MEWKEVDGEREGGEEERWKKGKREGGRRKERLETRGAYGKV